MQTVNFVVATKCMSNYGIYLSLKDCIVISEGTGSDWKERYFEGRACTIGNNACHIAGRVCQLTAVPMG